MAVGKFKVNLSIQLNLHSHCWLCQNATSVSTLIRSLQRGVHGRKILFLIGEKDCASWKARSDRRKRLCRLEIQISLEDTEQVFTF